MKRSLIFPAIAAGLLLPMTPQLVALAKPAIIKPAKDWAAHEKLLLANFLPGMMPAWNRTAGFLPSDIGTLWSWIDPAVNSFENINGTTAALADGSSVGYLTDRSGNSRHWLAAANDTTRPVLKTNIVNGRPVIRFAASSVTRIIGSDMSALTAGELFIVIKKAADPAGAADGIWQLGHDTFAEHVTYSDGNAYCGFMAYPRLSCGNPTPDLSATFRLWDIWSATNDWAFEIDGSAFYSTGSSTVSGNAAPKFGGNTAGDVNGDFDMAEACFFSAKLSGGDRTSMKSYIAAKYGLTIA